MPMFEKKLVHQGHTTTFSVVAGDVEGWEVRIEEDSRLVHRACYTDWHRVERALMQLSLDASALPSPDVIPRTDNRDR